MTKTIKEIAWLAGLLEGEGYFGCNRTAVIQLGMTDEDTISKARDMMSLDKKIYIISKENRKTIYYFKVQGSLAIQWMLTIYSLMSRRRKEKIREILAKYKEMPNRVYGALYCTKGHLLIGDDCRICINNKQREYRTDPKKLLEKSLRKLGMSEEEIKEKVLTVTLGNIH